MLSCELIEHVDSLLCRKSFSGDKKSPDVAKKYLQSWYGFSHYVVNW